MSYLTAVNFIDICSDAMLYAIDQSDNAQIIESNLHVKIDRSFSKCFTEKTIELVKSHKSYGSKCLLISTCLPTNNWRKTACSANSHLSLSNSLTEAADNIVVDNSKKLDKLIFAALNKCLNIDKECIICLSHDNVDSIDMTVILKQLVPYGLNILNGKFFMFEDINARYIHDGFIPSGLSLDVEMILKNNGII